eukprot:Blabericola_migrator_1__1554@NODE_140_length_13109_cov_183_610106_g122_i0_p8_GENE_NODE_140_length_13109_cov_183_610106_g122_i0NODE_140_length_13109_cov_183_610106_g122_i0_p8_ORF_typecomplete_len166_score12_56ORMDL/PF04061_14/0_24ORMDL/PF04061_14/15DUF3589/PF12141_8/0_15ABC2_membrane_3/PF12698_7/2_3_NODE_140_length_13109_cov_183_610106_g122_i09941491
MIFARKGLCFLLMILIGDSSQTSLLTITLSSVAMIFLLIHIKTKPFDRRNGGVLDKLEFWGLTTWLSSIMILHFISTLANRNSGIFITATILILLINVTYVGYMFVVLYYEVGNWLRTSFAMARFIWPLDALLARVISHSEQRKKKEPVVMFNARKNEVSRRSPV